MQYLIFITLIWLTRLRVIYSEDDYCSMSTCQGPHIACGNSGEFSPSCPADARLVEMRPHRREILRMFNELRNKVAGGGMQPFPKAARMATMNWCWELETFAKMNVRKCEMGHDKCRNTKYFAYAGQNVAMASYSGSEDSFSDEQLIKERIEKWFAESASTTPAQLLSFPADALNKIGHFTVSVQERCTHIGCSGARYTKSSMNYFLFTCNFSNNNISGRSIYEPSTTPASGCKHKEGPSKVYPNLCNCKEVYYNA